VSLVRRTRHLSTQLCSGERTGRRLLWSTTLLLPTLLSDGWLGSRVVSMLDSGAEGPRFKSQSRHCRVTVLGKLFTPIAYTQAAIWVAALLRVVGYLQAWQKVMAAYRRVYDSRHLQADCQELG